MGLLPEQKIIAALRMLTYGASVDQVDEIARMGKSTILESLMRFCRAIECLYIAEYIWKPTNMDLQRLQKKGEMRGFPRMIESIDWFRELKMTSMSLPIPSVQLYPARKGTKSHVLVPRSRSAKEKHFASCQEGCKKDVERCFGILQARWAIVRGAARMFDVESLRSIMMMCIILHNMNVEDEYDYDVVDEYEPDTMNNSRTQIYCAHDATEEPMQHKPLEKDGRYNEGLIQRYTALQWPYMHNA
ncbi:uncharacterized protein [Pyrus communis]|uniref:uncharacterized protein n=1 Tax=Pyrus communis TaxID=23211 RepID=UPI0035BEC0C1